MHELGAVDDEVDRLRERAAKLEQERTDWSKQETTRIEALVNAASAEERASLVRERDQAKAQMEPSPKAAKPNARRWLPPAAPRNAVAAANVVRRCRSVVRAALLRVLSSFVHARGT